MKKVKMIVTYSILNSLGEGLQMLIAKKPVTVEDKIKQALLVECWLHIQEKGAFEFQGEKRMSLSVPRALALMQGIKLLNPQGEYEQTYFLQIIGTIDQQTA